MFFSKILDLDELNKFYELLDLLSLKGVILLSD